MKKDFFSLILSACLTLILIFAVIIIQSRNTTTSPARNVLGIKDYLTQTNCNEPSSGCGGDKYWDYYSCSCKSASSYCYPPAEGCPANSYWDSATCSCKYSTTSCVEPSGGCGTNYYWDSGSCMCKTYTSTCTTPSAGCGNGYYWDEPSCSCKYSSPCVTPQGGCGTNYFWDSGSCSCKSSSTSGCSPPSSGCGTNYYWDSSSCSCRYSSPCVTPQGGCGTNYYWDSSTCSCKYSGSTCSQPQGGCASGSWWDPYSCSCKPSSCSPPSTGCGDNKYWDSYSCACKTSCPRPSSCTSDKMWDYYTCECKTNNYCNPPSSGCGVNYYWDSYYCSCKPYQGYTAASACSPPSSGCGSNFYWDSYSCSCKQYPEYYGCYAPTGGCGYGWYWDENLCACKSNTDPTNYYQATSYSSYEYEQNSDRLAYEPPERLKCIRALLTPTELERLRYLIPTNTKERDEVHTLGNRVASCWDQSRVPMQNASGQQITTSPIEAEKCLIKALGETTYREISQGKRAPSYKDHLYFEQCYGKVTPDSVKYLTDDQSMPSTTDGCLKGILGTDLYNKIKSGQANVPNDLRRKVDRCFGVDPQPFQEAGVYKIPEEIGSCLKNSVSEARFNEISSGAEPTSEEEVKAKSCFSKLNKDQVKFLPPPPEQIPYLDSNPDIVNVKEFTQETQTVKGKNIGGKVKFSGKAPPNTEVYIYIFSEPIVVTTKTDENGDWVYELNQPLTGEKHIAYATVRSDEGTTVRSQVFDFTVQAAPGNSEVQQFLEEESATNVQKKFLYFSAIVLIVCAFLVSSAVAVINIRRVRGVQIPKSDTQGKSETEL